MVSATEARIHFGELMRRAVEDGEAIIVERGGKPTVVLLSFEEHRRLVKGQQAHVDWTTLVAEARAQAQADLGDRALPPSEEILRQFREERDEQLLTVR
jgi:prevent-host-death family protein